MLEKNTHAFRRKENQPKLDKNKTSPEACTKATRDLLLESYGAEVAMEIAANIFLFMLSKQPGSGQFKEAVLELVDYTINVTRKPQTQHQ